jgi:hypothetical protein
MVGKTHQMEKTSNGPFLLTSLPWVTLIRKARISSAFEVQQ